MFIGIGPGVIVAVVVGCMAGSHAIARNASPQKKEDPKDKKK